MASHIDSPDEGPPLGYLPIPDMLADWPWQRKINPLYEEVAAEGNAWLRSFLPFNLKSQHAFEKGDFGLLAALTFPYVPRDQLRTCVDLFNVFFLFDEYTDVEPAPTVRKMLGVCIDALYNPRKPRPDGEVIIGEIVRQFWERGQRSLPHQNEEPFVASLIDYLHAVGAQAEACDSGTILTADAYLAIRREDAGARPLYVLGALFLSIPDHLHDDPLLARLTRLGCDLVAIDNDMISYNREQAAGNVDFSIVTITMHDNGLSLHDTARSLVERNAELEAQFMQCHAEFCSFSAGGLDGTSDSSIQRYMDHMGNMRRGIWCWSFECGRYFGERGSTYAKMQVIPLIPKKIRDPNLRGNQVDVFLMEEELAKL